MPTGLFAKAITVYVTGAVASMLTVIAQEKGMSESAVIRDAIEDLVERPRPPRDRDKEFKERLAAAASGKLGQTPREKGCQFDKRVNTYLDDDLYRALLDYCEEERLSKARTVRKALDEYVWEEMRKAGLADMSGMDSLAVTSPGGRRKP